MKKIQLILSVMIMLFAFGAIGQVESDTIIVPKIIIEDVDVEIEEEIEIEKEREKSEIRKEIEEELEDAIEEIEEAVEEIEEELEDIEEDFDISISIPELNKKRKEKKAKRAAKKQLKNVKTRYLLVDFGSNILLHKEDGTQFGDEYGSKFDQNIWKSRNWNVHFFRQRINLIKHKVNLEWGISGQFHKFNMTGRDSFTVDINYDMAAADFDKVRLQANYLTLPVQLNFETNPRRLSKSFHLTAGGYVGFLMGGNLRHESDYYGKVKVKKDLGLNKIAYGLMGSIGYGHLNIYGSFNLQSLLENEEDINVLSVGIQVFPY